MWTFIRRAPSLPGGGARVGEATAAVEPWPHQLRAFGRLYAPWPPRLLIADEVGLGKTIQAGLLLRQAWLAGRAKRILVLAPKAVLRQWQIDLREKFNLNWPIYDGGRLSRYPSRALRARREREVDPDRWHEEPAVVASSHLMRRKDRAAALLDAEPWDLVVLDEAHHARRRAGPSWCPPRKMTRSTQPTPAPLPPPLSSRRPPRKRTPPTTRPATPRGRGQFDGVHAVAADPRGNIYAADRDNDRVLAV